MVEQIKENIFLVTLDTIKAENLLEYKNILRMASDLQKKISVKLFQECIFVFANTDTKYPIYERPIFEVKTEGYKKRILIWIGEESGSLPSDELLTKFDLIFKAYMRQEYPEKHLYAMPMILPSEVPVQDVIPMSMKKYNVFFSGNLNRNRISMFAALNSKMSWWQRLLQPFYGGKGGTRLLKLVYGGKDFDISDEVQNSVLRFNNGFNTGLTKDEYARITANSKIILSPRGFSSTECFRIYESMRQGAVVINEKLPNVPHYHNIPIVQIKSWKHIKKLITELTNDIAYLEKMSAEAIQFYNEKLSIEAISNMIVAKVNDL